MADFVFNISKGRMAEFMDRIANNDPATACFIAIPLSASGTEVQGQQLDGVDDVLGDANFTEITTGQWDRIILNQVEVANDAAAQVNDVSMEMETDTASIAFDTIDSGTTTGILIAFGIEADVDTDANLVAVSHHDFAATGNGGTITATIPSTGFITSA